MENNTLIEEIDDSLFNDIKNEDTIISSLLLIGYALGIASYLMSKSIEIKKSLSTR